MYVPNPVNIADIDWVTLVRSMGIYVGYGPVKLSNITPEYRDHLVNEYLSSIVAGTMEYWEMVDRINMQVYNGELTTFDRACIKHFIHRAYRAGP